MKQILLVMKETYLRQVKTWSFIFMVLSPFIFGGLSIGLGMLSGSSTASYFDDEAVAIVTKNDTIKQDLSQVLHINFDYDDEKTASKAYKAEEVSGYIVIKESEEQITATYTGRGDLSNELRNALDRSLSTQQAQLNQANASLSSQQSEILSRKFSLDERVETDIAGMKKSVQYGVFMVLIFALYFILITYSSTTAQEVASEKGTKIMEVIFSSIPAAQYFYGRILGIFAVIATHIGIYIIGGVVAYTVAMQHPMMTDFIEKNPELFDIIVNAVPISTILYLVLGCLIYVALAALCGSVVTRPEDVNKAVQPVAYFTLIGFFGAMILGQQGVDSLLLKLGSYLPFISSFFMPIRVMNGYANGFEVGISLLLLILSTLGLIYYIGRVYAGMILQTDDLGLWQSFKKGISSR